MTIKFTKTGVVSRQKVEATAVGHSASGLTGENLMSSNPARVAIPVALALVAAGLWWQRDTHAQKNAG